MSTFNILSALPSPSPVAPPGAGPKIDILLNWLMYGGLAVCIAGIIAVGAIMAFNNDRGEGARITGKLGLALGGVIVISAASAVVGALA